MNKVRVVFDGMVLSSDDSMPIVVPREYRRACASYDDLDVRMVLYNSSGERYMAEFVVSHDDMLMNSDQSEYFDFIVLRKISSRKLNQSSFVTAEKIKTNIPRELGILLEDRDNLSSLNNEISI